MQIHMCWPFVFFSVGNLLFRVFDHLSIRSSVLFLAMFDFSLCGMDSNLFISCIFSQCGAVCKPSSAAMSPMVSTVCPRHRSLKWHSKDLWAAEHWISFFVFVLLPLVFRNSNLLLLLYLPGWSLIHLGVPLFGHCSGLGTAVVWVSLKVTCWSVTCCVVLLRGGLWGDD